MSRDLDRSRTSWLSLNGRSAACQVLAEHLQEGDLVFLDVDNLVYRNMTQVMGGWAAHVGVALRVEGEWQIAESTIPRCRYAPLPSFFRHHQSRRFALYRLQEGLTDVQMQGVMESARQRMGQWYHLGFDYDGSGQFCSKFVYDVFLHGAGVQVGEIEQFHDLWTKQPGLPLWFWRLWFLGRIPWARRTVTPQSQMVDGRWKCVVRAQFR